MIESKVADAPLNFCRGAAELAERHGSDGGCSAHTQTLELDFQRWYRRSRRDLLLILTHTHTHTSQAWRGPLKGFTRSGRRCVGRGLRRRDKVPPRRGAPAAPSCSRASLRRLRRWHPYLGTAAARQVRRLDKRQRWSWSGDGGGGRREEVKTKTLRHFAPARCVSAVPKLGAHQCARRIHGGAAGAAARKGSVCPRKCQWKQSRGKNK